MTPSEITDTVRTQTQAIASAANDLASFAVTLRGEDLTDDFVANALSTAQNLLEQHTGKAKNVISALLSLRSATRST